MKLSFAVCTVVLLAGSPLMALGSRQLSAVSGQPGVLPQPSQLTDLGSINTLAQPIVRLPAAQAPAPAPAAADLQDSLAAAPMSAPAPAPMVVAALSGAPAYVPSKTASLAAPSAFAPAPAPGAAKKRRGLPKSTVFILDAEYATLSLPDPEQPGEGTLQLTGFARHVSYFTDVRSGVRRSGRVPIQNFANTTFRDASNVTGGGSDNATVQPNAALYSSAGYYGGSDQLLRVLTLHGKPTVDDTNTTLTFNVTVAPSSSQPDAVTVYRVTFNTTANGTLDAPQVSAQELGTVDNYENVALYVGNWWWGMDQRQTTSGERRRQERQREARRQDPWSWFWWP